MRRTERTVLVAALVALGAAFVVGGDATAAEPRIEHQAWSRTGVAPAAAQPGSIYVSTVAGQEQARAYVDVDLTSIDTASLASATIELALASDSVGADDAALVVCALDGPIPRSGELTDDAPDADCSVSTSPTRSDDGTWSIALEPFAARWDGAALGGVAIVPDPAASAGTFVVSFDTARTALVLPSADASPTRDAPTPTTRAASSSSQVAPAASTPRWTPPTAPASPAPPTPTTARPQPVLAAPEIPDAPSAGMPNAARPSAALIALPMLAAGGVLWLRRRRPPTAPVTVPTAGAVRLGGWLAALLVVSLLGETTVYKLGIVAIVFTAAIGLHLLVNWCGELSLAHAAFLGLPAFAVAQLSTRTGWSPFVWLPVAVLLGAALGSIVAVAALRARGLQVALVTLAFAIAAGQFLFFQRWIVGPPEGLRVRTLGSSRELVPILAATLVLVVAAARSLMGSMIGRAFLFVRAEPDAAAAAGIPVARYRAAAYAVAGAFAGVAGWQYVIWVQQVNAKAFPLQLGFTYLVIAALAGAGGLGGVAVAALVIQGGSLFSILPPTAALYVAPVALILNVTRYPAGFNGVLRTIGAALSKHGGRLMPASRSIGIVTVIGTLAVVGGIGAIALAWYHMGNTDQQWIQNQELMSGGVGGLALIIVGSALLVRDALLTARGTEAAAAPPATRAASNGHHPQRTAPLVASSRS